MTSVKDSLGMWGEICLNMKRADNGTRTRGLDLGKVALYQLSYVRMGNQTVYAA